MKKEVRGLVKNNKGNCKRVYRMEINHECEINMVIKGGNYTVFEIKNGKNEMIKPILRGEYKNFKDNLNNVKNGKDNKTYVLICKDEPYRAYFGREYDNNEVKDIIVKEENEEIKK